MRNLSLINIERPQNLQLSKDWVPYIRKKDFDNLAEEFFEEVLPNKLLSNLLLFQLESITSAMGLTIHHEKISVDDSIIGQMVFKILYSK